MFDKLAQRYFSTEEQYAEGLELLQQYLEAASTCHDFDELQTNFLDRLDDSSDEIGLLDSALRFTKAKALANNGEVAPYSNKTNASGLTIEALDDYLSSKFSLMFQNASKSHLRSIPIQSAFNEFLESKRPNWKPLGDSESTYKNEIFALFHEVVGDVITTDLTKEHSNAYKKAVLHLPKNRRKMPEFRDLSIHQLINLPIPPKNLLSNKTKGNYLSKLAAFLDWLANNDYAVSDLSVPLGGIIKSNKRADEEKNIYTDEDLAKLFNSPQYLHGLHNHSFKFWVPLIGLLTGARLNEICQLFVTDIYKHKETNIWVFNINEDDSTNTKKSLKVETHTRFVPIHPQLINLGILEFVEYRRNMNEKRLFPELWCRNSNKYADKAQRWFNTTYTNSANCNITSSKTSFHSLRHTVINYFSHKLGIETNKFAYVVGQTPTGNVADTRYIKPPALIEFHTYFKKLDYSHCIDFSKIRLWRNHDFYKLSR